VSLPSRAPLPPTVHCPPSDPVTEPGVLTVTAVPIPEVRRCLLVRNHGEMTLLSFSFFKKQSS
jgi:hypothetical protein